MSEILCKILGFLKYILLILAFGLVFYGIMVTYGRLQKPLTDAVSVFLPFGFVLLTFIVSMFTKSKSVSKSLFFNLVSTFSFVVIIFICLRAMFDTNMLLFHKYQINYNPSFFADNLSAVIAMLYMIGGANVLMLICDFINKEKKVKKISTEEK